MSEYAKAPSSPGLARVGDGVQSPREERVLIWPVSGDHHVHVSTISFGAVSGHPPQRGSRKPEAHECVGALMQRAGPLALISLSTFCWCLQASHAACACAEVGPVRCMCTPTHSSTPLPCHLPRVPTTLPQQTCPAHTLSRGSKSMQRQAGKGPRPEFQSLK